MGEKAAKKHQEGCAAQTQEVQAKRRKKIEKSRPVGAALAAASTKRKWQPHSSQGTHARREVDLTDTMTDAHIDALFGPLNLNAANSRLTGNSGRTGT